MSRMRKHQSAIRPSKSNAGLQTATKPQKRQQLILNESNTGLEALTNINVENLEENDKNQ